MLPSLFSLLIPHTTGFNVKKREVFVVFVAVCAELVHTQCRHNKYFWNNNFWMGNFYRYSHGSSRAEELFHWFSSFFLPFFSHLFFVFSVFTIFVRSLSCRVSFIRRSEEETFRTTERRFVLPVLLFVFRCFSSSFFIFSAFFSVRFLHIYSLNIGSSFSFLYLCRCCVVARKKTLKWKWISIWKSFCCCFCCSGTYT